MRSMNVLEAETTLTCAQVMAIVPTTDLERAKAFYGEQLGLVEANVPTPGPQVIYRCGASTLLEVYERPTAGDAQHTLASWQVRDLKAAVDQLRDRGVRFEEYDLPDVRTEDGISATGRLREAWFRDPDGNILRIHSHAET
jgi:catechol 2,3-dioxygenase-like lactoylglutathione lyase family enzyme